MSHPHCHGPEGHTCDDPSGRVCIVPDCDQPAGTIWGPYWCPTHDEERLDNVTAGFENLLTKFGEGADHD